MPRLSLTKSQLETPAALDLLQLLQSVTADGHVTDAEIGALGEWLRQHAATSVPAIGYLTEVVQRVLADGRISDEERTWVQKAVETVLPTTARQEAAVRRREAVAEERKQAAEEREQEREEDRLARPIKHFDVMVAGAFFDNRQVAIGGLNEGTKITLAREDKNPFSPNAILFLRPDGRQIGYMPESEAVNLAHLIDSGARHGAEVKKILEGSRGLIPVVWGELYAANSPEGQPSPRVAFAQMPQPAAPSVPPPPAQATPPLVPRSAKLGSRIVLGILITLAVVALVVVLSALGLI
jgi:hypothetical protein